MTWSRRFETPIEVDGITLRTLLDAGEYVSALPKAKQVEPHWQMAADLLLKGAERGWAILFAEIGMRKALNHGKPPPERPPRRKRAKVYKIVR